MYVKKILVLSLFLFTIHSLSSQDTLNSTYFRDLEHALKKDSNVEKTYFVKKKYFNGNVKRQAMFVKYKDDNTKRYWMIGNSYQYYSNGQLACVNHINIQDKRLVDTSMCWDREGNITQMLFFPKDSSLKYFPVRELYGFYSIFRKYFKSFPEKYKEMRYDCGLRTEREYCFKEGKGWLVEGPELYYNEEGELVKVIYYKFGERISNK